MSLSHKMYSTIDVKTHHHAYDLVSFPHLDTITSQISQGIHKSFVDYVSYITYILKAQFDWWSILGLLHEKPIYYGKCHNLHTRSSQQWFSLR
jgi:hypothetical protein